MSTGSFAESPTLERPPAAPMPQAEPGWRPVVRFGVAVAVSAAVCLGVWTRVPRVLSGQIDIVGYPTFNDWDLYPPFWAYRLIIYVFPILTIGSYLLLRWRGPVRRTGPALERGPIVLRERDTEPGAASPWAVWLGVVPRLALPFGVVLVAAGTRGGHVDSVAISCGLVYLATVLGTAASWAALTARRATAGAGTGWTAFRTRLAVTNAAAGSLAACLGVWYVSGNTTVTMGGVVRHYPWMPWWLAVLGAAGVGWWIVGQLRRSRPAPDVEKIVLGAVVGAIALFLAISTISPPEGWMQGFDGAQDIAGARLLNDGFVPWRDFLFIHGWWQDGLKANFSMAIFGDTVWGVASGILIFLFPLCYVGTYLFAAWVSRCNPWFLALVWVGLGNGFVRDAIDIRFILVAVTYIVFGEAIRRRGGAWYVGLTLLLFVEAVLVPETAFMTAPALICVVAADLVHRERGESLWRAMRRTRWTVATGVVSVAVFCAVLAYYHALTAFIAYYRVFGPGHDASGAIPPTHGATRANLFFALGIAAVLVTAWATVRRFLRHDSWAPEDWVALACAGFVALYGEKALGRFDIWHVAQVFDIAMPLVLLWGWRVLRAINLAAVDWSAPRLRWGGWFANATTAAALVIALVVFATPLRTMADGVETQHMTQASSDTVYPGLGYATTAAVDTAAVADLQTALNAYARDEPVFDMTNSIGYTYYLLQRIPATRFVHLSMAIPQYAQQLLISDLARSRPPVVIFDATETGLTDWDGITNGVRHYEVSDYVLRGWVPVLRTHGYLLLVRKDLVAQGVSVPTLQQAPQTSDLWFTEPTCDWGYSAAFLQSLPQGQSVRLPVRQVQSGSQVTISGWAANRENGQPSNLVVIANGNQVITTVTPSIARRDAMTAQHLSSPTIGFNYSGFVDSGASLTEYMVDTDGKLHPLVGSTGPLVPSVRLPDGRVLTTDPRPEGYLNVNTVVRATIGQLDVPAGVNVADYSLATISAGQQPVGSAYFQISDAPEQGSHEITARSLTGQGKDLAVRVGSCIQWHGYDTAKPLYLLQAGGLTATTVTLSGVKQ